MLRNGDWRGLRLTVCNWISTPLARPRYALTIRTSADQPARQAPSTPACHAGCFRSFHIERPTASRPRTRATKPTPAEPRTPPDRYIRARLRCSSRASLPLTPQAGTLTATIGMRPATSLRTKTKLVKTTPSGCRASWVLLRVQCCPRPYRPENALSIKSVREHFQVGRAARRWQSLVGVRWQRFQCRVAAFYFQRVSLPVQFWRACGCPPQFRPSVPWWQPLVWRWLRLSGWQR